MQKPYEPFENDRLTWIATSSESGGAVVAKREDEDHGMRKPAVLLFVAKTDAKNCCAANYERIAFMDRKVVGLAKKRFVTLRIDRSSAKKGMLARYAVKHGKPALLVLDCEGSVFARFETCVNARDVHKAMTSCLKLSKKKKQTVRKVERLLEGARKDLKANRIRKASVALRRVVKTKYRPDFAANTAQTILDTLEKEGRAEFERTRKKEKDPTKRWDVYTRLRWDLWTFKDFSKQVGAEIGKLETNEKTAQVVFLHKGEVKVDQALAMIKQGKGVAGRALLRKVRQEFKNTPAAERAKQALAKK